MTMGKNLFRKCLTAGIFLGFFGLVTQIGFPSSIYAAEPFKIGMIFALSGSGVRDGIQMKQAVEWMLPEINAKGGILGRKVEVIFEDERMDPAIALRKARKLVEEDKVNVIVGPMMSSSALAISAMLSTFKVPMVSIEPGVGELTGSKYSKYFFRVVHSTPMETKAIALFLKDNPQFKTFYGIGLDYAWGRGLVAGLQEEIGKMGRQWLGSVFAPLGTTEFSSYIAKIQQMKPDVVWISLAGAEAVAFNLQAKKFGLTKESQFLVAQLPLADMQTTGDTVEGFIGHSRYAFTIDNAKNKAFVEKFHKENNYWPDFYHGGTYDAVNLLLKAVEKTGTGEADAVIKAMEGLELDGVHGKFIMRACDHQAVLDGFVVKAVKAEGYQHLIPKIIKVLPGEAIVPPCRKDKHD
jgi:branched-chain amino acid transport system substrate-binding protein